MTGERNTSPTVDDGDEILVGNEPCEVVYSPGHAADHVALLGDTIEDPTSPAFLAAIALFLVVTVGAGLAARRMRASDPAVAGDV